MKTYGLIGYPLSHSFSPAYFENKFRQENISGAEYKLFPLKKIEELSSLIKNNPSLCGLNVTIPYKESVINYLDKLDESAEKAKAVNCIHIKRTSSQTKFLTGYNTDISGFRNSFIKHFKPHHKKALILGTGGAAKAVSQVLAEFHIEHLFVTRKLSGEKSHSAEYKTIDKHFIEDSTVIVNATPLGMFPNVNEYPSIPYEYITENHLLFDLIYNPSETLFMKKGKEKGATVVNGLEMLHLQAEESWQIWNR